MIKPGEAQIPLESLLFSFRHSMQNALEEGGVIIEVDS